MRTIFSLGTAALLSAIMLGTPSESKAQFGLSVRFNVGRDYDRGRFYRPGPVRGVYRPAPVVVQPRRTVIVPARRPVYVAPRAYYGGRRGPACYGGRDFGGGRGSYYRGHRY